MKPVSACLKLTVSTKSVVYTLASIELPPLSAQEFLLMTAR